MKVIEHGNVIIDEHTLTISDFEVEGGTFYELQDYAIEWAINRLQTTQAALKHGPSPKPAITKGLCGWDDMGTPVE